MIKPQPQSFLHKPNRPFPLYRLPSLLKRALSVPDVESADDPLRPLAKVRSASEPLSSTSDILLDLLPSVRSNAFVWTYTRLLCTSASYIAGMSFYDLLASLMSLGHEQMRIYDVMGNDRPIHSRYKLLMAWTTTVLLVVGVVLAVKKVVQLSERRYAYQIHREVEKMQKIEQRMAIKRNAALHHQHQHRQNPRHAPPQSVLEEPSDSLPVNGESTALHCVNGTAVTAAPKPAPPRHESDDDEELSVDSSLDLSALSEPGDGADAHLLSSSSSPRSQSRSREAVDVHVQQKHAALLAKVKAEEDKRAVTRAMLSAASYQTEEEEQEEEEVEQALEEAMQAGLSAAEIAREASQQRRAMARHDPVNRISSSVIFLYRLCDLVCYYSIFVAVYAFQNTLQFTMGSETLLWSSVYLVALFAATITAIALLERHQEAIALALLQEHPPASMSLLSRPVPGKRAKKLKVRQASWRKLSSYVSSSFSYLLAYAAWAVMQASLQLVVPGEVLTHVWYLWLNALIVLCLSGVFLVLLNVRVRSALTGDGQADRSSAESLVHQLCFTSLINRIKRPRASTARLHIRVDILSGNVTSSYSQMLTECLSYLIALSIGAALTASLPAAPADAARYSHEVQPTARALIVYALSCSVVLAALTLWIERWIRRMERGNTDKAREALRKSAEGRERIGIKEVTKRGAVKGAGWDGQCTEQFSANTHETALYVLRKQQLYEKKLRAKDGDDAKDRDKRKQRAANTDNPPHSPSPTDALSSPRVTASSPLLSSPLSASLPHPQCYGSQLGRIGISEPSTPLFSPQTSPTTSSSSAAAASASVPSVHRSLLIGTFLKEWYVAVAACLTQGCALLVAYAWVGVFTLVLFPALRQWSVLSNVSDVLIKAMWSAATFVFYFACILVAAKLFHREEVFEL